MKKQNPIEQITIKGFLSFRDLDNFKLKKLNIFIGPNGAGKSNFVSYFRMLEELRKGALQSWVTSSGNANRILTYGLKKTAKFYSAIEFNINKYEFELNPTVDDKLFFEQEIAYSKKTKEKKTEAKNFGSGHGETKLKGNIKEKENSATNSVYVSIQDRKVYHFQDTTNYTAEVKYYYPLHDNEYLRSNASNLAAFLYRLKREHHNEYDMIRKTVALAIPFFDDFLLKPQKMATGEEQIRLMWQQKGSDYPWLPSQLSDGSLRFICLVTALMQPDPPSTIIIDEPELGLHPYAIVLIGSLIKSASTKTQIIVATQSVTLLNEFNIDDLIIVELENGVSVFKRLNESDFKEWLNEYSVGELWEKNVLGGRPS